MLSLKQRFATWIGSLNHYLEDSQCLTEVSLGTVRITQGRLKKDVLYGLPVQLVSSEVNLGTQVRGGKPTEVTSSGLSLEVALVSPPQAPGEKGFEEHLERWWSRKDRAVRSLVDAAKQPGVAKQARTWLGRRMLNTVQRLINAKIENVKVKIFLPSNAGGVDIRCRQLTIVTGAVTHLHVSGLELRLLRAEGAADTGGEGATILNLALEARFSADPQGSGEDAALRVAPDPPPPRLLIAVRPSQPAGEDQEESAAAAPMVAELCPASVATLRACVDAYFRSAAAGEQLLQAGAVRGLPALSRPRLDLAEEDGLEMRAVPKDQDLADLYVNAYRKPEAHRTLRDWQLVRWAEAVRSRQWLAKRRLQAGAKASEPQQEEEDEKGPRKLDVQVVLDECAIRCAGRLGEQGPRLKFTVVGTTCRARIVLDPPPTHADAGGKAHQQKDVGVPPHDVRIVLNVQHSWMLLEDPSLSETALDILALNGSTTTGAAVKMDLDEVWDALRFDPEVKATSAICARLVFRSEGVQGPSARPVVDEAISLYLRHAPLQVQLREQRVMRAVEVCIPLARAACSTGVLERPTPPTTESPASDQDGAAPEWRYVLELDVDVEAPEITWAPLPEKSEYMLSRFGRLKLRTCDWERQQTLWDQPGGTQGGISEDLQRCWDQPLQKNLLTRFGLACLCDFENAGLERHIPDRGGHPHRKVEVLKFKRVLLSARQHKARGSTMDGRLSGEEDLMEVQPDVWRIIADGGVIRCTLTCEVRRLIDRILVAAATLFSTANRLWDEEGTRLEAGRVAASSSLLELQREEVQQGAQAITGDAPSEPAATADGEEEDGYATAAEDGDSTEAPPMARSRVRPPLEGQLDGKTESMTEASAEKVNPKAQVTVKVYNSGNLELNVGFTEAVMLARLSIAGGSACLASPPAAFPEAFRGCPAEGETKGWALRVRCHRFVVMDIREMANLGMNGEVVVEEDRQHRSVRNKDHFLLSGHRSDMECCDFSYCDREEGLSSLCLTLQDQKVQVLPQLMMDLLTWTAHIRCPPPAPPDPPASGEAEVEGTPPGHHAHPPVPPPPPPATSPPDAPPPEPPSFLANWRRQMTGGTAIRGTAVAGAVVRREGSPRAASFLPPPADSGGRLFARARSFSGGGGGGVPAEGAMELRELRRAGTGVTAFGVDAAVTLAGGASPPAPYKMDISITVSEGGFLLPVLETSGKEDQLEARLWHPNDHFEILGDLDVKLLLTQAGADIDSLNFEKCCIRRSRSAAEPVMLCDSFWIRSRGYYKEEPAPLERQQSLATAALPAVPTPLGENPGRTAIAEARPTALVFESIRVEPFVIRLSPHDLGLLLGSMQALAEREARTMEPSASKSNTSIERPPSASPDGAPATSPPAYPPFKVRAFLSIMLEHYQEGQELKWQLIEGRPAREVLSICLAMPPRRLPPEPGDLCMKAEAVFATNSSTIEVEARGVNVQVLSYNYRVGVLEPVLLPCSLDLKYLSPGPKGAAALVKITSSRRVGAVVTPPFLRLLALLQTQISEEEATDQKYGTKLTGRNLSGIPVTLCRASGDGRTEVLTLPGRCQSERMDSLLRAPGGGAASFTAGVSDAAGKRLVEVRLQQRDDGGAHAGPKDDARLASGHTLFDLDREQILLWNTPHGELVVRHCLPAPPRQLLLITSTVCIVNAMQRHLEVRFLWAADHPFVIEDDDLPLCMPYASFSSLDLQQEACDSIVDAEVRTGDNGIRLPAEHALSVPLSVMIRSAAGTVMLQVRPTGGGYEWCQPFRAGGAGAPEEGSRACKGVTTTEIFHLSFRATVMYSCCNVFIEAPLRVKNACPFPVFCRFGVELGEDGLMLGEPLGHVLVRAGLGYISVYDGLGGRIQLQVAEMERLLCPVHLDAQGQLWWDCDGQRRYAQLEAGTRAVRITRDEEAIKFSCYNPCVLDVVNNHSAVEVGKHQVHEEFGIFHNVAVSFGNGEWSLPLRLAVHGLSALEPAEVNWHGVPFRLLVRRMGLLGSELVVFVHTWFVDATNLTVQLAYAGLKVQPLAEVTALPDAEPPRGSRRRCCSSLQANSASDEALFLYLATDERGPQGATRVAVPDQGYFSSALLGEKMCTIRTETIARSSTYGTECKLVTLVPAVMLFNKADMTLYFEWVHEPDCKIKLLPDESGPFWGTAAGGGHDRKVILRYEAAASDEISGTSPPLTVSFENTGAYPVRLGSKLVCVELDDDMGTLAVTVRPREYCHKLVNELADVRTAVVCEGEDPSEDAFVVQTDGRDGISWFGAGRATGAWHLVMRRGSSQWSRRLDLSKSGALPDERAAAHIQVDIQKRVAVVTVRALSSKETGSQGRMVQATQVMEVELKGLHIGFVADSHVDAVAEAQRTEVFSLALDAITLSVTDMADNSRKSVLDVGVIQADMRPTGRRQRPDVLLASGSVGGSRFLHLHLRRWATRSQVYHLTELAMRIAPIEANLTEVVTQQFGSFLYDAFPGRRGLSCADAHRRKQDLYKEPPEPGTKLRIDKLRISELTVVVFCRLFLPETDFLPSTARRLIEVLGFGTQTLIVEGAQVKLRQLTRPQRRDGPPLVGSLWGVANSVLRGYDAKSAALALIANSNAALGGLLGRRYWSQVFGCCERRRSVTAVRAPVCKINDSGVVEVPARRTTREGLLLPPQRTASALGSGQPCAAPPEPRCTRFRRLSAALEPLGGLVLRLLGCVEAILGRCCGPCLLQSRVGDYLLWARRRLGGRGRQGARGSRPGQFLGGQEPSQAYFDSRALLLPQGNSRLEDQLHD